jgi:hypothetical protein
MWSEWSSPWHYTVKDPTPRITELSFEAADPQSNFVYINACANNGDTVNVGLRVKVNHANDGSANGEWAIIKEQGSPCFNSTDRPRWDTSTFSDGTHRVRLEAFRTQESGGPPSDVREETYTLPHRKPPAPHLVGPSNDDKRNVYLSDRTITFTWEPSDRTNTYEFILSLTHQAVADDPSPLLRVTLPPNQTSYTYTFDQFYPTVYWGVRAFNDVGYGGSDNGYAIGLDNQPPNAAASALPTVTDSTSFVVRWSGTDNNAGIDHHDVQVRDGPDGTWKFWLTNTTATAAIYPGAHGHIYAFRVRAADRAGNLGTFADDGDTSTRVDLYANPDNTWWNAAYQYRRDLVALYRGAQAMPPGYPLRLRFDNTTTPTAADLCGASRSAVPGNDFRVVYNNAIELDRHIKAFSCSEIDIWFAAQVGLAPGGSDTSSYKLYYGNPAAAAPPANLLNIFQPGREAGTLALYDFEEDGGNVAVDISGNGHNGTV